MNEVLTASIFGVITLLLWGSGSWLLAESSRRSFNGMQVNFAVQAVSLPIALLLLMFSSQVSLDNSRIILFIVLETAVLTCAFLAFIKALSRGPTGVVVPLQSIYPLFLLLLSAIFLNQIFSVVQVISIFMIVSGVFLVAYERQKNKTWKFSIDKKMAILSAFLWGLGNFILNSIVDEASWQTIYAVGNVCIFVFALLLILITSNKRLEDIKEALIHKRALLAGLVVTLGSLSFLVGGTLVGSVVIILSIASAEPLIAALLSRIFDKEILSMHKRVGAIIVVVALIILNVYG